MKYLGLLLTGIKLLYLLSGLKSLVEKWQARRQGAEQQAQKDQSHILEAANARAEIENRVGGASDDELRNGLLGDSPGTER